MLSIIKSMSLHGLNGSLVNVEVDVSGGLPSWDIVGNYYKILENVVFSRTLEMYEKSFKITTRSLLQDK